MRKLALEIIDHQNQDPFPGKLTSAIEAIYQSIEKKEFKDNKTLQEKSPQIKKIEKLIRERFNLNMIFDKELAEYLPAAVLPFLSDYLIEANNLKKASPSGFSGLFGSTNIFKHIQKLDKEKDEYLKRIHGRKGFVDLKLARVGGYLADVKNYLIINFFDLMNEGMTASEVCAVILHEIGHAFVGLETHHNLTTTNSVIAEVLTEINNNKTDKAYYIFKKHFDQKDIAEASLGGQKEVSDFYGKLAQTYVGELQSQFLNGKYDQTNYENLADSFATRLGMGKDLVSGLHKLHVNYGVVTHNTRLMWFIVLFIEMLFILIWIALTGSVAWGIIIPVVLATIFGLIETSTHMTYDEPLDRYNRIKNNIIANLKNQKLPVKVVKDLVDQYIYIDSIIKTFMIKPEPLDLSKYFSPSKRADNYHIHLQQTIENNLNSVLFLKSAQVRTV